MRKTFILAIIGLTAVIVVGVWLFFSIFDQKMTRKWGFNTEIHLTAGQKFIGYDWLEDNVWTASRPMRPGEEPERVTISEHSRFGALEGSITIVESK